MRRNIKIPGRLRWAAAEILSQNGMNVSSWDIHPAQGHWRKVDVFRWEVSTDHETLGCWQTLTEFVKKAKHGGSVVIGKNSDGEASIVCLDPKEKS